MTATDEARWIGRSLERREDLRLLTGQGEYLADLRVPDCLHLCFVRSSHAHAKIREIRLETALAIPGVVGAITGAELSKEIQGQKIPVLIPAFAATYRQYWPLAVDEVYWHGEPLAAILAQDKYVAEDAAAAIEVDYEPLPVVTDAETALRDGAPRVYDDWDNNEIFGTSCTGGSEADEIAANDAEVEALFAKADVVLKQRFRTHRCGVCPIETRGALAIWSESDGLTVHLTTQRPHIERLALADLLELSTAEVRVVAPRDQGGGFGVKAPFYREHVVVCHLARKLARPVRWIETREEHLMTVSQERDQIHDLEIAADKEGRILALRNRGIADVGDGRQGVYWGFVMPSLGSVMLPNAYAIGRADIKLRCAVTNKACLSPSRSFGALPTRFALERGLDMLARKLGLETADLKRRNLITDFPFTSVTGVHHDSGDYVKAWDTLLAKVDLAGFRALQEEARAEGHYLGIGFACGAEFSGIPSERAGAPGKPARLRRRHHAHRPARQGRNPRRRRAAGPEPRDHDGAGRRRRIRHSPGRRERAARRYRYDAAQLGHHRRARRLLHRCRHRRRRGRSQDEDGALHDPRSWPGGSEPRRIQLQGRRGHLQEGWQYPP